MRRPLSLALLALALPGAAQNLPGLTPAQPIRDLKDAMILELSDPKTQVAIAVTSGQRDLMAMRLTRESAMKGLDLVRAALQSDGDASALAFSVTFNVSPVMALYPYLASNQVAKLRRLTLAHQPLQALGTEEVAFALSLTDGQRKAIEAIRARQAQAALNPNRPSVRFLANAMARVLKEAKKAEGEDGDNTVSVESIDQMRPIFDRLFRDLETASRLAAKEPAIKTPDPLKLLTSVQRRRYSELSQGSVALVRRRSLVVKRN